MIFVIADDLTGAAEIGGVGLQFQMKVEITTAQNLNTGADLLIIATNIRSKPPREINKILQDITRRLRQLKKKPEFIYAKVDSVLRGNIIAELTALMGGLGKEKALLVPANPHLGRIIKDGVYYVNEKRLSETGFNSAPELVLNSSLVKRLLAGDDDERTVHLHKSQEVIPDKGIIVGEAVTEKDLKKWVERLDDDMVVSGAAGFFSAVLEERGLKRSKKSRARLIKQDIKKLFVCGSAHALSRELTMTAIKSGRAVSLMPAEIIGRNEGVHLLTAFQQWAEEIVGLFKKNNTVIIATNPDELLPENGSIIEKNMAIVVDRVLDSCDVTELLIEGGATAFAVFQKLGCSGFYPERTFACGVIRMKVAERPELHITLKPGSYSWPTGLWPGE